MFFSVLIYKNPANIYLFKFNNKDTRKSCETCSKLTIETLKRRQWHRSSVFIVKFKHISHFSLVFLLQIWAGESIFKDKYWQWPRWGEDQVVSQHQRGSHTWKHKKQKIKLKLQLTVQFFDPCNSKPLLFLKIFGTI